MGRLDSHQAIRMFNSILYWAILQLFTQDYLLLKTFFLQSFKSDADDEEEEVVAEVTKKTAAMKMAEKEAAAPVEVS